MWQVQTTYQSKDIQYGVLTVGTVPVRVGMVGSRALVKGLLLRACGSQDFLSQNSDCIYVGGPNVTADQSPSGGFPLLPGASLELPAAQAEDIWCISGTPGQILNWLAV
jgi:hypothetical protein